MLNKIFLQGRLTRDPELRHTQSGTPVASFSLAVDRDFKDKDSGEKKADFIQCVAWRQTGEFVSRFFSKGRMAIVEGRLQMQEYTDRDGNRRTLAEVIVDNVYFGDSKKDGGGTASAPATTSSGYYADSAQDALAKPYLTQNLSPYRSDPGPIRSELTDDDGELPF